MAELKKALGTFSCTMLVAGNMIGIGIFITAGRISNVLPNPQMILLAWVIGGILSLAGALAYAELGTRFPRAGGHYIYLRESFGPFWGFLSGFSASLVTLPGAAAFLAIGFTKYAGIADPITAKIVAVGLIFSISLINVLGVQWGAGLQDSFMVLKLLLIFILILAGFFSGQGSFHHFAISNEAPNSLWVAIPLAMVPILYTYSGWDATSYVAGEVKNPRITIPHSLFRGTLLVTIVYLLLASLYIYALPVDSPENKTKIVTVASKIFFGETIGNAIGGLVALSILGCLSATILTSPRIQYAMARDGLFPASMGEVHSIFFSPSKAIYLQAILASFLAITGTFDQLLDYVTVPAIFFQMMTVVGLFKIRARNHSDQGTETYRTVGYPYLPLLFTGSMFWIILNTILKHPKDSLWGLLIVSLGIPFYFFGKRFFPQNSTPIQIGEK
ncbi:MAG: amino acid permease [Elusimicrobia bacterium]|nr:amino acid permease [Elusimicrobiota bacterium]